MGILWRLLAPKPLKRARRTVRKATHPVHTATRAVTPKPVKKLQRAAHPLSLVELKTEDAVVNALQGKRTRRPARKRAPYRPPADGMAPARAAPPPAAPRPAVPPPQAQPWPGAEADYQLRNGQREAQIAEHYARRQTRISERAAERQAKAAGRAAVYQAKTTARRQRRAARKEARGPWRWPEWTLAAALAAFVAFCVLAGTTGKHMPNAAGIPLFLIFTLGGIVGVPVVLWRWYRARQAAAAMLAGQSQADGQAPHPGTWT